MKKNHLKRLAFLGMATGALVAQSGVEAVESNTLSINQDFVLAKAKASCKAHGGCGSLTAERDRKNTNIYQDDDELPDANIPEDTYEDGKKV